jgi:hypothetical protein
MHNPDTKRRSIVTKLNLPEGRTAVPVGDTVQGARKIPRYSGLNVLLAIAAIVLIMAVVALQVWILPLTTSEVGTEAANPNGGAGSAIIHDDAGNIPPTGAGSAVIHDDAGNMP